MVQVAHTHVTRTQPLPNNPGHGGYHAEAKSLSTSAPIKHCITNHCTAIIAGEAHRDATRVDNI